MKKIVLIAAIAALAACSQEPEAPADTATADTTAAADDAMADDAATADAAAAEAAGTYDITYPDGKKGTLTVAADGTFTNVDGAGTTMTGTVAQKDGKSCFKQEDGTEMCWKNAEPGADGSYASTADDGSTVTVMKRPA